MNSCLQELLQHITAGQAEDATSKLLTWLTDYQKRHPEGEHEIENLQGQVVVLSGNLATAQRDFLASLITRDNHNLVVAKVSQGLLRVINNLDDYTVFSAYLEEVEEEVAWEKALDAKQAGERQQARGDLQSWWDGLPPAWRKALINEIGHFGKVGKKQLQRVLGLKTIDLSNNQQIQDIEPLRHMASLSP
jgi:hypothetical protein